MGRRKQKNILIFDETHNPSTVLSEIVSELQLNESNIPKRLRAESNCEETRKKKVKRKQETEQNGEEEDSDGSIFTSSIISDVWELIEIKKLLSDQFLSAQRKVYYNSRVPELNESIMKQLLVRINNKDTDEFTVLNKLHEGTQNSAYSVDQKHEFSTLMDILLKKISIGASQECWKRLNDLSFVSDEKKRQLLNESNKNEVTPVRNDLNHFLICDTLRLLNIIRRLAENPFFDDVSLKSMMDNIRKYRETETQKLILPPDVVYGEDELRNVAIFVQDSRTTEAVRTKIHEKINDVRRKSMNTIKNSKTKLKDQLLKSDDFILFKGTNLEFIQGYGILEPPYVRCVNIWKHKKEKKVKS